MGHGPARLRVLIVLAVLSGLLFIGWKWIVMAAWDLHDLTAWLEPHRHAWYALPLVMLAFVVLAAVPVLALVAATGIAFGPVLGPLYAMAGCLASASMCFAIGRWLGLERVERWGGSRLQRITRALKRNGTLAVFLVRKVPAPFALVNIVIGASTIGYREFVIGTVLGMGAIVVLLAGFGYQLAEVVRDPSPTSVLTAALLLGVPLTVAWFVNRVLRPVESAR